MKVFSMRHCATCLAALALLLCFSGVGRAHKVNVFAYADGDAVQVEASFGKSRKVKQGKLVVTDLETGATLLEGATDGRGAFRFRPDDDFLKSGHGLNILLLAGEGHRDNWQVSPEELASLSPPGSPKAASFASGAPGASGASGASGAPGASGTPAASGASGTPGAPGAVSAAAPASPGISAVQANAELEALIGKTLDAKLAPIKQALARQEKDNGPSLRDIIGGIGWIFGLFGVAAYMKHRR